MMPCTFTAMFLDRSLHKYSIRVNVIFHHECKNKTMQIDFIETHSLDMYFSHNNSTMCYDLSTIEISAIENQNNGGIICDNE